MSDDFIALSSDTDDAVIEQRQQEGIQPELQPSTEAERAAPEAPAPAVGAVVQGAGQPRLGKPIGEQTAGEQAGGVLANAHGVEASSPPEHLPKPAAQIMAELGPAEGMPHEHKPASVPPAEAVVAPAAADAAPDQAEEPAPHAEAAAAPAAAAAAGGLDASAHEVQAAAETPVEAEAAGMDGESLAGQPLLGEAVAPGTADEHQGSVEAAPAAGGPAATPPATTGAAAAAVQTPEIEKELLGAASKNADSAQTSPPAALVPGHARAAAEGQCAQTPAAPRDGAGGGPAEQPHVPADLPLLVFEDKGGTAAGATDRWVAALKCRTTAAPALNWCEAMHATRSK